MEKILSIEPLADHKELVTTVAEWCFEAFDGPGTSVEKCEEIFQNRLNINCLDTCFLAFLDGQAVGTASLTSGTIPKHSTLSPCLSNLFVLEKYRHAGIGQSLIEYAQQKLRDMNFTEAYLYTTKLTIHLWYAKFGWELIEEDKVNDVSIKIMKCKI